MGRKNVNMGTDGPNGTVWGRKMLKRVEKLRKPGQKDVETGKPNMATGRKKEETVRKNVETGRKK